MTSQVAGAPPGAWPRARAAETGSRAEPDVRRVLRLVLAGVWLLDAVLQFQHVMFTRAFGQTLAATAPGNPAVIATPIAWSASLISRHAVAADAAFAVIQLLLGLGIAWRPAVRLALAASVAWSLGVWWLGEGLGGLFNGTASPVSGAPGAVILYALLALLLWPRRADRQLPFAAAGAIGEHAARLLWLVLWGGLAWLALAPATAGPHGLARVVGGMASSQPGWLAAVDHQLAAVLSSHGPATAIGLAAVLAIIAAGVYLPGQAVRLVLALALLTTAAFWLAQGLGGLMTGAGTDPNSAPLLALLALSFWPLRRSGAGETGLDRHPGSRRVPTTSTMTMPAIRMVP